MRYSAVFAALFAGYVAAQSGTSSASPPTGTSGISACILQCSMQAAESAGCTNFSDPSCACGNSDFQSAAAQCLAAECTPEEQQAALQLQQALCGSWTGSATGSATPTETETETPTETSSSGSRTATAPASSSSTASVTSRASASSVSRTSSIAQSASSVVASLSSAAASASGSGNSAAALPAFNFATAGIWAAVALGGAAAAQLVL
ncbi:hypothetical protein FRC06_011635 [Ceratobasidium sp. 370]|nr:hypothetical protein FRC06_011635 [Ceratobasidium sp. 370]